MKRHADEKAGKVCDQTRQKENLLPCPAPYVTEVMFYDIHPDSDTHQLEVLSPLSGASIWNSATGRRTKTRRTRVDSDKKAHKSALYLFISSNSGAGMVDRRFFWNSEQKRVCFFSCSFSTKVRAAAKTERYNGENREKEKSCFVPVAPLIWGEVGNASRIKCYFHSFSLLLSLSLSLQNQIK